MPIQRIEDLSDAVRGAGLEAPQMTREGVCGSLAFAEADGTVISSGPSACRWKRCMSAVSPRALRDEGGRHLLALLIGHSSRDPRPIAGPSRGRGRARVVARPRAYIVAHLDQPISRAALAEAAATSERTLHRAFLSLLGEPPRSFVRRLRLHRIRHDLATQAEAACTVAIVANRWGIGELGRLSGWHRDLFGGLPSETLSRRSRPDFVA